MINISIHNNEISYLRVGKNEENLMLKLFLLRHGKAANPEGYDQDYDRPLNKKGVAQINQVGYQLLKEVTGIGQIISSSAKRTEETTLIANNFLGVSAISHHRELYLANQEQILDSIQNLASHQSILYVGHNFGISDIASYLSGENISMSTGMLIELSFDIDDWRLITHNSATIITTFTPNILIP
jgi:phosphohistidine phosphatase